MNLAIFLNTDKHEKPLSTKRYTPKRWHMFFTPNSMMHQILRKLKIIKTGFWKNHRKFNICTEQLIYMRYVNTWHKEFIFFCRILGH